MALALALTKAMLSFPYKLETVEDLRQAVVAIRVAKRDKIFGSFTFLKQPWDSTAKDSLFLHGIHVLIQSVG